MGTFQEFLSFFFLRKPFWKTPLNGCFQLFRWFININYSFCFLFFFVDKFYKIGYIGAILGTKIAWKIILISICILMSGHYEMWFGPYGYGIAAKLPNMQSFLREILPC